MTKYSDKPEWSTMLNLITNDLVALSKSNLIHESLGATNFESIYLLAKMYTEDLLSSRGMKDVLAILYEKVVIRKNSRREKFNSENDEGEIKAIIEKIISENP